MYWWTGILGLLLVAAPFALGYSGDANAMWSHVILGIVALLASAYKPLAKKVSTWEYWTAGIAGLLAIIAPFALGFGNQPTPMWTSIVLGVLLAIVAGYEIFRPKPEAGQRQIT